MHDSLIFTEAGIMIRVLQDSTKQEDILKTKNVREKNRKKEDSHVSRLLHSKQRRARASQCYLKPWLLNVALATVYHESSILRAV